MTDKSYDLATLTPPKVEVPDPENSPVLSLNPEEMKRLGENLTRLFGQFRSDRRIAELKWMRNLRQYLGVYDPEIEKELSPNRSKAYPKITRVKVISTLSRLMNLMFPGNEDNWTLSASPSPDMDPKDVQLAIAMAVEKDKKAGIQPSMDIDYVLAAVNTLAQKRAKEVAVLLKDQMAELGGDQTLDYVGLNRAVLKSGILYGMGVLYGPYARSHKSAEWSLPPGGGLPIVKSKTVYKPIYEFGTVWDCYPDMAAKTLHSMDGYFRRHVMSRSQVLALAKRKDFLSDQVKDYLKRNMTGNYKPQEYETELRAMGVKVNVNEMKQETQKYELISWHGPISASFLMAAGVPVPDSHKAEEMDAEVWMIDGNVIKAEINPWRKLGADVKTAHFFLFDEDDTSPVGNGLPNVIRDSQMSIAAATRMLLDNASVTCGPQLELNTDLLRTDQDLSAIAAMKIWYRTGEQGDAQAPAVRNVQIDSHMDELLKVIDLFMKFVDMETFVGPTTGGDMEKAPSEPMRTAAGASMMRGDAALPFKDIVRSFDVFTMSVVQSMVQFNRLLNPTLTPVAEFDIIARGATSLIAKEVRGMQIDLLAQTLKPEDMIYVDEAKFVRARFEVRDLGDMMLSDAEVDRAKQAREQQNARIQQLTEALQQANERKLLADAYKNITQGQKNSAAADAENVNTALSVLTQGVQSEVAGVAQSLHPEQSGNAPAGEGDTGNGDAGGAGGPAVGDTGPVP